ncbi:Hypothetical protein FKW44_004381 [Caligus rogercresseyi]|uniref:Uncharacterized protein n=1 Tax=Caligus rogercresseyi TaxID=217165 RepID=A0A7T8HM20_CALRO|nr:Hypothetical protein FKW44_004381 [Caligus rogercresseyi]
MYALIIEKLGPTSGPTEKYFARLASYFNGLIKEVKKVIKTEAHDRIAFVSAKDAVTHEFLEATNLFFANYGNSYQRGDYKEFARLVKAELEWTDKVGEIHHGRWITAAIYVLKMTICGEDRVQMGRSRGVTIGKQRRQLLKGPRPLRGPLTDIWWAPNAIAWCSKFLSNPPDTCVPGRTVFIPQLMPDFNMTVCRLKRTPIANQWYF